MGDITFAVPSESPEFLELAKQKYQLDIDRATAEIAKINDERRKITNEMAAQDALLRSLQAEATVNEIRAAENVLNQKIELARNFHYCVYRFHEHVEAGSVTDCMNTLTVWDRMHPEKDMEIIFNSPGGSVIDGFELFDFIQELKRKGHHITTSTRGMAASMGGILLQAGDKRVMGKEAVVLIHQVSAVALGKIGEIEDEVELIHKLQSRALGIFAAGSAKALENGTS